MPRPVPTCLVAILLHALAALPLQADAPLVVLDRTQLPFDLGPGHPANSPAQPANQPHAAPNSAGNTANSAAAWGNRPSNPENEKRLIFTQDGEVLGYYAPNGMGVLNLFDINGRRVAYRPAHGTQSLFTAQGAWCGTADGTRDGLVLAVTPDCARLFIR
jgi:hypothetical protein